MMRAEQVRHTKLAQIRITSKNAILSLISH
jgi:hypothetical protein